MRLANIGAIAVGSALLFTAMNLASPSESLACDPSCGTFERFFGSVAVGLPTITGTTLLAPLIGFGIDKAVNGGPSPYWISVGFTAGASVTALAIMNGIHALTTDDFSGVLSDDTGAFVTFFMLPSLLAGTLATVLTYTLWPRANPEEIEEFEEEPISLMFMPLPGGGQLSVGASF